MNLDRMIGAAALAMPQARAEELCRNLAQGLTGCEEESELFLRTAVAGAIAHRVQHFGLVVMGAPIGALSSRIVDAWRSA